MDDSTYRRWAHGLCPCCAGSICEGTYGGQPRAIGEGVMICGRCAENEHDDIPGLIDAMLLAIASRDDTPLDVLINGASANLVTDQAKLVGIGRRIA